jgi:predicted DsbA family dithiol-disulfide isomerase
MPLSIAIVSDVVCPWCLIGTSRLEKALEAFPDLDVQVTYLPFLLDPKTPPEGVDLRDSLRRKYGADPEQMFPRVEAAARETGIQLDFEKVRRHPNTIKAHTLIRHALAKGTQRALAKALFHAHFLDARDVNDDAVLVELATAHGFAPDEAKALLANAKELAATREEAQSMSEQGISGVPFFIFQDALAVSGAQPVAVFKSAIEKAKALPAQQAAAPA